VTACGDGPSLVPEALRFIFENVTRPVMVDTDDR
jgi:hypothetical protein